MTERWQCEGCEGIVAEIVVSADSKFGHVKMLYLETCSIGDLVPRLLEFPPPLHRGDAKGRSGDLGFSLDPPVHLHRQPVH